MIRIIRQYAPLPCPTALLTTAAKSVYRREGVSAAQSTDVILCSDYMIRKLNRRYRGKDKATDVLSFRFGDDDLLGEVYISLQRAKVQARRYGVSYENELKRLLVHGLLHLLGYDHVKRADRIIMEKKENAYLKTTPRGRSSISQINATDRPAADRRCWRGRITDPPRKDGAASRRPPHSHTPATRRAKTERPAAAPPTPPTPRRLPTTQ